MQAKKLLFAILVWMGGIRGKQMMLRLMNKSFLAKTKIINFVCVAVNHMVPIFGDLRARSGRKLQADRQTHTPVQLP